MSGASPNPSSEEDVPGPVGRGNSGGWRGPGSAVERERRLLSRAVPMRGRRCRPRCGTLGGMAIRILGINGGIRPGGTAERALRFTLRALEAEGARCETFEIGALPILDGRADDQYPAAVAAWRAACTAADGFVLVVPSYHGGAPGSLKNALDFIDLPHAAGKPFAVIGIAGGDAEPGVTDVTRVMRHIGGIAGVPDVVISRAGEHWGSGDDPANKSVAFAIAKVSDDLVALCTLRADGKLPQP